MNEKQNELETPEETRAIDILIEGIAGRAAKALDLRPEVLAFAQLMEAELRLRDEQKGVSYADIRTSKLQSELSDAVRTLEVTIFGDPTPLTSVATRAALVANLAMFLAVVEGGLMDQQPGSGRGN